jgi:hypothetical protein
MNMNFKPSEVQNSTRINIYDALAVPTLVYRNENLTAKAKDGTKISVAEMNLMRAAKFTGMYYRRNENLLQEFILNNILKYRSDWIHLVGRMLNRLPELNKYSLHGSGNRGRPLRRIWAIAAGTCEQVPNFLTSK